MRSSCAAAEISPGARAIRSGSEAGATTLAALKVSSRPDGPPVSFVRTASFTPGWIVSKASRRTASSAPASVLASGARKGGTHSVTIVGAGVPVGGVSVDGTIGGAVAADVGVAIAAFGLQAVSENASAPARRAQRLRDMSRIIQPVVRGRWSVAGKVAICASGFH